LLGFDLSQPTGRIRLHTASGFATAPLIRVPTITALERVRTNMLVAAHNLPLGVEADGLLGLDFFRGFILKLDFIRGCSRLPHASGGSSGGEFSRLRFASHSRTIKSPASNPTFKVRACLPIHPAPGRGFHADR